MIDKIIKQRTELAILIWKAFLAGQMYQSGHVLNKIAAENLYQISELSCLAWPETSANYAEEVDLFGKSVIEEPEQNEVTLLKKILSVEREIKGEIQKIIRAGALTDIVKRNLEVLAKQHENHLSGLQAEQLKIQTLVS